MTPIGAGIALTPEEAIRLGRGLISQAIDVQRRNDVMEG
jgi:hypothetical protein